MFYTYAHYTPSGDLFYIGKGSGNRYVSSSRRSKEWKDVVASNGFPKAVILAMWDTEAEAFAHERDLILYFRKCGALLCNLAEGGQGPNGFKLSETAKAKISASLAGNTRSVGHVQTVEHRSVNSQKQLGNSRAKGNTHSAEHLKKISTLLKGNKNALGSDYTWVGVHQVTGERRVFSNTTELSRAGFQHANVIKCINGTRKSHKGYTWSKEPIGAPHGIDS